MGHPPVCLNGLPSLSEPEPGGGPLKPGFGLSGDVQISSILSSRPEQITARAVTCEVEGPCVYCLHRARGAGGPPFDACMHRFHRWCPILAFFARVGGDAAGSAVSPLRLFESAGFGDR